MNTVIIGSINHNMEEKRISLVLVEESGLYQWHIFEDGELVTVGAAPIEDNIDLAIFVAELLWEGDAWGLVLAPHSLIEAIEQEWPGQTKNIEALELLGYVSLVESTKKGDYLWHFPEACEEFWVVVGAAGGSFVSMDRESDWDNINPVTKTEEYYAVYQVSGPIYGSGATKQEALADAKMWLDDESLDDDGNLIIDDDLIIDGHLCLAKCSKEVHEKVQEIGGNIKYNDEGNFISVDGE